MYVPLKSHFEINFLTKQEKETSSCLRPLQRKNVDDHRCFTSWTAFLQTLRARGGIVNGSVVSAAAKALIKQQSVNA